jgi:hypothetical protein
MTKDLFTGILETAFALVVFILTGGLAIIFLGKIARGDINLNRLISEPNGDASLSRLQLLIFTFVISLGLFLVIVGTFPPKFPDSIPADIMTLLGISASSYLVSKGIQFSSPAGVARQGLTLSPSQVDFTVPGAATTQKFTATIANGDPATPMPVITWSLDAPALGSIDANGVYTAPAPGPHPPATVMIRAQASGYEDGLAKVTVGQGAAPTTTTVAPTTTAAPTTTPVP